MALQMRVYAEIASVEAKVMWGMGWRQLVASALMLVLGGGEVAVFFLLLEQPDLARTCCSWCVCRRRCGAGGVPRA